MVKLLPQIILVAALCSCSTPSFPLASFSQIMEKSKRDFSSCCDIDESDYDICAHQDPEGGWTASALPKLRSCPTGGVCASGGGDVHLFYTSAGSLKGMYRGQ